VGSGVEKNQVGLTSCDVLLGEATIDQAMLRPEAKHRWYLSVLDEMAAQHLVWTYSIHGLGWAEIDYPLDLVRASKMVGSWSRGTTRASFG